MKLLCRCRLGLHKMKWDEYAYSSSDPYDPPEPGWLCVGCDKPYPDVEPLRWRLADWFYGETRLGRWLGNRGGELD
jgi:hypothetical protein